MNARSAARLAVLSIAVVACACASSGPRIRADADPTADLSSYHTFAFFDDLATDKSSYTTMVTSRLKSSTQRELERRGYVMSPAGAQLLVNFNLNLENRTDVESTPSMGGYYGYRTGRYGMWSGYPADVTTTHYQQGTLAIDLVDAAKRQLVWQGVAEGRIRKQAIDNPGAAIDKVVTEIFASYPATARAAQK